MKTFSNIAKVLSKRTFPQTMNTPTEKSENKTNKINFFDFCERNTVFFVFFFLMFFFQQKNQKFWSKTSFGRLVALQVGKGKEIFCFVVCRASLGDHRTGQNIRKKANITGQISSPC